MACAAMRLAVRIFPMVSGSLTSEPVNLAGAGFQAYSGRGIDAGTGRTGETVPWASEPRGAVVAMWGIPSILSVLGCRRAGPRPMAGARNLERKRSAPMANYWFNVVTHQVEEGPQSDWTQLIGPYETREEAEKALEKV